MYDPSDSSESEYYFTYKGMDPADKGHYTVTRSGKVKYYGRKHRVHIGKKIKIVKGDTYYVKHSYVTENLKGHR
jgi:predicted GNAT family acetyltransferase